MSTRFRSSLRTWCLAAVSGLIASACGGSNLEGAYWSINAQAVEDRCTGAPASVNEKFEYRVIYEGQDIQVAVGEDVFASGTAEGCLLTYESVTWTEERGEFKVAWRLLGQAEAQTGGGCDMTDGLDWVGTEWFEIMSSEDPALSPGCEYEMALTGKFIEEVK